MLDILAIAGPIYFCISVGFVVTRAGLFTKADMRVLGKFVINLGLPALLFNAISQRPLRDVMNLDYLGAYTLGSMAVLTGGYFWARYVLRSVPSYCAHFCDGCVVFQQWLRWLPGVAACAEATGCRCCCKHWAGCCSTP